MTTLVDWQGQSYDFGALKFLANQIAHSKWRGMSGGAYKTKNESIGFKAADLAAALGVASVNPMQQVIFDMARFLYQMGVRDLNNFRLPTYGRGPVPNLQGFADASNELAPYQFGATFTGIGGTFYNMVQRLDGPPEFFTIGRSSSDVTPEMLAFLKIALAVTGVGAELALLVQEAFAGAVEAVSVIAEGSDMGQLGSFDFGSFDFGGSLDVNMTGPDFTMPAFSDLSVTGPLTDVPGDWGPSIDYGADGVDLSTVSPDMAADFSDAQSALDNWNSQLDAQWQQQTGAVTADQFNAMSGMQSKAVSEAAKAALKQVGAGSTPNASQIKAAQQVAIQQRQVATNTPDAAKWTLAGNVLNAFAQYQNGTSNVPNPANQQFPPQVPNSVVRQPDGSISIRRPDGTIATIGANGQLAVTPASSSKLNLPSGMMLPILGVAAVAGIMLMRGRH